MTLKKEMEDILYPERKELTPPRAPIGEKDRNSNESSLGIISSSTGETSSTDSKPIIDFRNLDPKYQKWCLSLETQRHYSYTKFGKTSRENIETIKRQLQEREMELDVVKLMKKQQKPLFSAVMSEFKSKLERIKK